MCVRRRRAAPLEVAMLAVTVEILKTFEDFDVEPFFHRLSGIDYVALSKR